MNIIENIIRSFSLSLLWWFPRRVSVYDSFKVFVKGETLMGVKLSAIDFKEKNFSTLWRGRV